MKTKIFILLLALFAFQSHAQFLFDQEQDYFVKAGVLQASTIGDISNILSQLMNIEEKSYTTTITETAESLALSYYGTATFAPLIIRANNHYVWNSNNLIKNVLLCLPSALYCTQFVGIDCIYDSYQKSLTTSASSNYWKDLPDSIKEQLVNHIKYPNYMYFVMTLLEDGLFSPQPSLTVRILNLLDADLVNGRVSFTTGFGKSLKSVIPTSEEATYYAYRSDLLQGIHGTLSYDVSQTLVQAQRTFDIDFHVYASNGTFRNSMIVSGQANWLYTTSAGGKRELSLGNGLKAQVSISYSPAAVMTVVLYPDVATLPDFSASVMRIAPNHIADVALDGKWNDKGYYGLGALATSNKVWQGWRLIPLQSAAAGSTGNRFLIVNANSSLALEVDAAYGNVTMSVPNKRNPNQIWKVIESSTKSLFYFKGANNLCMVVNAQSYLPFSNNQLKNHRLSLANCWGGGTTFKIEPLTNYVYE